jgi:hypothetical protein
MKRRAFTLLVLLGLSIELHAQYSVVSPSPVRTPKLTSIEVLQSTTTDWNGTQKGDIRDDIEDNYPGITFLSDATKTYNCHNYAWHMSDGGAYTYWMNQNTGTPSANIQNYWTDGSFVEVCNEADATKIFYYAGDHSAIKSSVSGMYESKWGDAIRLRHSPTNVPAGYVGTSRRYFVPTKVTGSTALLCSGTRGFSVASISGASYTWAVSGTLSIVSGQGTGTLTVQRNGSSSGQAWIEVQISTPCSGGTVTSKREYFHVGLAQPNFINVLTDECPEFRYGTNNFGGFVSLYTWRHRFLPSGSLITNTNSNPDIKIMAYTAGSYYIEVKTTNACGDSPYYGITEYLSCGGSFAMKAFPNPANEILNLEFDVDAVPNNLPEEILLYSEKSAEPVKSINTKHFYERQLFTEGSKIILDVKSLPRGVYYLHLISKQQNTEKIRIILE